MSFYCDTCKRSFSDNICHSDHGSLGRPCPGKLVETDFQFEPGCWGKHLDGTFRSCGHQPFCKCGPNPGQETADETTARWRAEFGTTVRLMDDEWEIILDGLLHIEFSDPERISALRDKIARKSYW